MKYKKTAEYVFDLLEHEYYKHCDIIQLIGVNNIQVCVPLKLKENLKAKYEMYIAIEKCNVEAYPNKYRGIDIVYLNVENVMFKLK